MSDTTTEAPPTSTAATGATEPTVIAAIMSGEGRPPAPRKADPRTGYRAMALLAAGVALGCAAGLWRRRYPS